MVRTSSLPLHMLRSIDALIRNAQPQSLCPFYLTLAHSHGCDALIPMPSRDGNEAAPVDGNHHAEAGRIAGRAGRLNDQRASHLSVTGEIVPNANGPDFPSQEPKAALAHQLSGLMRLGTSHGHLFYVPSPRPGTSLTFTR